MLRSITLDNVASYKEEAQEIGPLQPLNFIYGENGCGKSTIAELLDCEFNERTPRKNFSNCSVCSGWEEGTSRKICVYDADFVKSVIEPTTFDGVFVMGKDAPELEKELVDKEVEIGKQNKVISDAEGNITQISDEIASEVKEFTDYCWKIGTPYSGMFNEAYIGYKKPHKKFMARCIEFAEKEEESKSLEELQEAAKLYFSPDGRPEDLNSLPIFSWVEFSSLEGHSILEKAIKGKEDTTIAELIATLGNNDWVDQGRDFFDGVKCPFCQQEAPKSLREDLESYFDETYKQQKEILSEFAEQFETEMQQLVQSINDYAELENELFKFEDVKLALKAIEASIIRNKNEINRKIKEPSEVISFEKITEQLEFIFGVITSSNKAIEVYNKKLGTFDDGKKQLKKDIWTYLGAKVSPAYKAYKRKVSGQNRGITNLIDKKSAAESEITNLKLRISEIGEKLKNIAKPAQDINNILQQFGFSNFTITQVDEQAKYSIVRENGDLANTTLSEGEKTFIAFLYFYQMVKGVDPESNTLDDKIIVFDDPVSSLDSKVLYVVSRLINDLMKSRSEVKIHQIFLLTHNIYFFKEVTPRSNDHALLAISNFWLIRKSADKSIVENHESNNPIRSSYQMLWEEVKSADKYPDLDLRNTLRRILENYFKIFGDMNIRDLATGFSGDNEQICHSLLDWVNDGSHYVGDDLFIAQTPQARENYLKVFEAIFANNGQGGHFELMMGRVPQPIG